MTHQSDEPLTGPVLDGPSSSSFVSGPPLSFGPESIRRSRVIAWFTDDLVRIPGTNIGIGLDALIGLIPGFGDAAGSLFTGAIMLDAVKQRVPYTVLARMGLNLLLDLGLGLIPGIGDIADVAHRANRNNYLLLEQCVTEGRRVDTSVAGYVSRATLIVIVVQVLAWAFIAVLLFLMVSGFSSLFSR